jgi:hypothetical protein
MRQAHAGNLAAREKDFPQIMADVSLTYSSDCGGCEGFPTIADIRRH